MTARWTSMPAQTKTASAGRDVVERDGGREREAVAGGDRLAVEARDRPLVDVALDDPVRHPQRLDRADQRDHRVVRQRQEAEAEPGADLAASMANLPSLRFAAADGGAAPRVGRFRGLDDMRAARIGPLPQCDPRESARAAGASNWRGCLPATLRRKYRRSATYVHVRASTCDRLPDDDNAPTPPMPCTQRIRLHHRRRRLGRMRARQPPHRAAGGARCCCSRPARRIAASSSTCPRRSRIRSRARSTTGRTKRSPSPAWTAGACRARAGASSAARRRSTAWCTSAGTRSTTTAGPRRRASSSGRMRTASRIS